MGFTLFQWEIHCTCNNEIAKIHSKNLKIFFTKTTGPISPIWHKSFLGEGNSSFFYLRATSFFNGKYFKNLFLISIEGLCPFLRGENNEMLKFENLPLQNSWSNFNQIKAQSILGCFNRKLGTNRPWVN